VCVYVCRLYLPVLHTYTPTYMWACYGSCAYMCTTDTHAFVYVCFVTSPTEVLAGVMRHTPPHAAVTAGSRLRGGWDLGCH